MNTDLINANVFALALVGFTLRHDVVPLATLGELLYSLEMCEGDAKVVRRGRAYAQRNLLSIPAVRTLADSPELRALVEPILGPRALCVRGILFDKVPQANWHVGWHQDRAIAVKERIDVPGFGPWSVKAGVVHVEPPLAVLEKMLTLRVHLDACDDSNGPLRVIPRSHALGKLSTEEINATTQTNIAVTCCTGAGGVLLMRPLLLHASSPAESMGEHQHRRVVHLEYAGVELPGGLRWHEAQ